MKRAATLVALVLAFLLVLGGTAFAQFTTDPGVTVEEGVGENCNGIIPTPGSENTLKTLVGGTLVPGGTAMFRISYPLDADEIGDAWEIVDCVLIGTGTDLKKYTEIGKATFSGVSNSEVFLLNFTFTIPADATIGDRICNVAKTTEGPTAPQQSNRKAGPACFIIGGDARVEKHSTTDPNGPVIPGATFVVNNCVNTSLTPEIQPLLVNGVSIVPGPGTLTITNSTGVITFAGAVGSHCDVTETVAPLGYGLPDDVTQTVTIGEAGTQTVVKFLDPPAPGDLLISKVAPAGSTQVFTFNIVCTNPSNNYTATITGTGTDTVEDIPAGSECTVTEVVPSGFNPPVYSPGQTVTIVSGQIVTVTVTNTLAPGNLRITKVAPAGSNQTFTFNIACTNPVNNYTLQITGSGSATQEGIPAGSICTVTETVPTGFATPVFDPVGPYTIGAGQTIGITVTNALLPGSLTINKVAPAGSTDTFTFNIVCTNPSNTYQIQIIGSGSATQTGIPAGSVCTITEVVPAGYEQPLFSPSNIVTIAADTGSSVTVTNTLLPGSLIITKVAPAGVEDEEFAFDVICTLGAATNVYSTVITGSGSDTIDGIPAGSTCTVTEINILAGFAPPTYSPPGGTVLVPGGAAAAVGVTVTNTLLPLGILVVKTADVVGGVPGDSVTYTYEVTNTGEVDLVDVLVTDDKLGDICTLDTLAVDETKTCTKTTTLPNAAGLLTNVATATGSDRFGRSTSDTDDETVTVVLAAPPLERPIPRTGVDVVVLAWAGLGLLVLGSMMLRTGKRGAVAAAFAGKSASLGFDGELPVGHVASRPRWRWAGGGFHRLRSRKRPSNT